MARRTVEERIAAERERRAKSDARLKALQAQASKTERARDTRRKVLLGALVIDELTTQGPLAETLDRWLRERLPGYLSRETDRELMEQFLGGDHAPAGREPPNTDD